MHVDRTNSSSMLPLFRRAVLCLFLAISMGATVFAQPVSEYDVEAAYLYNFSKFVRWPDSIKEVSSFDICILGDDPFGGTLNRLIANDHMGGKPIRKRIISHSADSSGCVIVYVSNSEAGNLRQILSAFAGHDKLLVSNLPNFARQGGMIQFVLQDGRVRFEINLNSASQSHLTLSSELLRVATRVIGKKSNAVSQ